MLNRCFCQGLQLLTGFVPCCLRQLSGWVTSLPHMPSPDRLLNTAVLAPLPPQQAETKFLSPTTTTKVTPDNSLAPLLSHITHCSLFTNLPGPCGDSGQRSPPSWPPLLSLLLDVSYMFPLYTPPKVLGWQVDFLLPPCLR